MRRHVSPQEYIPQLRAQKMEAQEIATESYTRRTHKCLLPRSRPKRPTAGKNGGRPIRVLRKKFHRCVTRVGWDTEWQEGLYREVAAAPAAGVMCGCRALYAAKPLLVRNIGGWHREKGGGTGNPLMGWQPSQ